MIVYEARLMTEDKNQVFEQLYLKEAPQWSLERDPNGQYKHHATMSAYVVFLELWHKIQWLESKQNDLVIPDGYALVPINPNEKMILNALLVISTGIGKEDLQEEIKMMWEKMLLAAKGEANELLAMLSEKYQPNCLK